MRCLSGGPRRMRASATLTTASTMPAAAPATRATMFRPSARILMRLVLARFGASRARRVGRRMRRPFRDFELRRGRELHLPLEHLLDVLEQ